jgi:hypothetical protein
MGLFAVHPFGHIPSSSKQHENLILSAFVQQVFLGASEYERKMRRGKTNIGLGWGMRQNVQKKKRKRELLESEEVEEQTRLRLRWLTIKEMEHDHKMRSKAIRLCQKRKKQVDSWVV